MLAKKVRKSAKRSGRKGMKRIRATFKSAAVGILSGTFKGTVYLCSTETAHFKPPIHTHTQCGKWDLMIAHPPCTFLTISGNRWFDIEKYGEAAIERLQDREDGKAFFMRFIEADCDKIAVENPIGIMSTTFRKPDCIIQPWQFGDNFTKTTCLWLKGLPPLSPEVFEKPEMEYFEWIDKKSGRRKRQNMWYYEAFLNAKSAKERQRLRSKTFPGIARAMAEQWGEPRNFVQTEWGEQYTLF